jgi:hypothetical protein
MIPLYGFLQGDSLGLLILAQAEDTIEVLADKLKSSASVRVLPQPGGQVLHQGQFLDPKKRVSETPLSALDRFDVVWEG